jgi:hypothetical protein
MTTILHPNKYKKYEAQNVEREIGRLGGGFAGVLHWASRG